MISAMLRDDCSGCVGEASVTKWTVKVIAGSGKLRAVGTKDEFGGANVVPIDD